jgi:WD40 repeat protein
MGLVLQGFDRKLQRRVALKVLDPLLANNEVARKRFCREARAAAAVTHEHVVAVHQVEREEGSGLPFLVMQLVAGESLEQRLRRAGRLEVPEQIHVGWQIASGLAAAHAEGLIHRDIKPANILLERGTDRVKLTDFGLARAAEDVKLTQTGFVAGTPLYMAPEQARGEELDHRADLFSLGVVLYEMCTGSPPFVGNTPLTVLRRLTEEPHRPVREQNPDVPEWLASVIDRLLAKQPADRVQTAAEVAELFEGHVCQLQTPSPIQVPALPPSSRTTAPAARGAGRNWLFAGGALLLLAGGLFLTEATGLTRIFAPGRHAESKEEGDSPALRATLPGNAGPIWSTAFAPDGGTLALAIDDGTVKLWDLWGERVRLTLQAHRGPVWSVAFSPGGDTLATASSDATVKLWDVATGKERQALKHANAVRSIDFARDGQRLVSGSRDGSVRVWDLDSGESRLLGKGHDGEVVAVAFSPDGRTAASGSGDRTVRLWDVANEQEQLKLQGHQGGVYAVAFAPDGRRVASGGWDKTIRLWDAASGKELAVLRGHGQDVWALAFAPDGRTLASASEDRTVRLWDVADGRELASYRGHTGTVYTVAFAPDGRAVASGGRDGTVRVWSVRPEN